MNAHVRYWLFQIPGLLLAGAIGVGLNWYGLASHRTAWMIFGLWLAKDILFYPVLVHSFRTKSNSGVDKFIGMQARVRQTLDPTGVVWIHGERWIAQSIDESRIEVDQTVVVEATSDMKLLVKLAENESHSTKT